MLRTFPEHVLRHVEDLAGLWDFAFLGDISADTVQAAAIRYDDRMMVPACFDASPRYAGKRGLAAYRRTIRLSDASRHRLLFGAVHHWARVYLDGRLLHEHTIGGFARFAVDITGHAPGAALAGGGAAELVVLVDNRYDPVRAPLHVPYADWYHYGGITRGVELHRLGELWIDAVRVTTLDVARRRVRVAVKWAADAAVKGPVPLAMSLDGTPVRQEAAALKGKSGELVYELSLPKAQPWSPEAPNLHLLSVQLGADDLQDRIGLRQVAIKGRKILLNGQPLKLLGFNRHEAHPEFGHAIPETLMLHDLQLLREMGCNFVRGSHYPQDQKFLDLCDELGFLVWNESIGWQYKLEHLTDKRFMKALMGNTEAMVAAAVNRPSVILWGIINESPSHEKAARPAYAALLARLRTLDSTRPVTYACNNWKGDVCGDLADIVALNIYPGWYYDQLADLDARANGKEGGAMDRIIRHVDGRLGNSGKPLMVSEIGADAVPGCRDWNADRWSEPYQAALLGKVIENLFLKNKRAMGLAIWQFCDTRTSEGLPRILGKPCGFNMKGVLTAYRLPKEAYHVVKAAYRRVRAGGR